MDPSERLNYIVRYLKAEQGPGIRRISELTAHLLISNFENACDIHALKEYGVSAVLSLGDSPKKEKVVEGYQKNKIKEFPLSVVRLQPPVYFEKAYLIIHKYLAASKKILVHCETGNTFSAAVVIYYFLKRYYMTNFHVNVPKTREIADPKTSFLLDIIKFVKDFRPCINPPRPLLQHLLVIETQIKKHYQDLLIQEAKEFKKQKVKKENTDTDAETDDFDDDSEDDGLENYLDYLEAEKSDAKTKTKTKKKIEEPEDENPLAPIDKLEDIYLIERSDDEVDEADKDENQLSDSEPVEF